MPHQLQHDVETAEQQNEHRLGILGMLMSSAGVALMTVTMLGSAAAAVIWSSGNLMGLPDWFLLPFYGAAAAAVLWVTIWATGRAWHVERLLENGRDIDVPVFKALHYWTKRLIAAALPPGAIALGGEWLNTVMIAV